MAFPVRELCWTLLPHWRAVWVILVTPYWPNKGWEQLPSSVGIKTLRKTMLDSLTRRFSKAEDTNSLVLATVLDPRYKDKAFTSAETVEKAKDWLKEEAAHDMAKTVEETGEEEDPATRQTLQTDMWYRPINRLLGFSRSKLSLLYRPLKIHYQSTSTPYLHTDTTTWWQSSHMIHLNTWN